MPTCALGGLHHEWLALQEQYDSYEKFSLVIKLVSVILGSCMLFAWHQPLWAACMLTILWAQDSIWKTFQNRIGQRLLSVENALSENHSQTAMQFNSQWLASRMGGSGLMLEYLHQAVKPTVAFPHIVMVGLGLVYYILY